MLGGVCRVGAGIKLVQPQEGGSCDQFRVVVSMRYRAHLEQAEVPSLELASQAVGVLAELREHLSDGALSSGVSPFLLSCLSCRVQGTLWKWLRD